MKIKQLIDRFRGKRKVSDIVSELNSRIKEEWGVNANIEINIHQQGNRYTLDGARELGQLIAKEFDNTTLEDENEGTHWTQTRQKINENYVEITVYWNDENEA